MCIIDFGIVHFSGLTRRKLKQLQTEAIEQARLEKEGMAVLEIKMANLFAVGGETVSVELGKSVNNLKKFEVSVNLDGPLMSEELSRTLNPMTITVCKASNLPPPPLPPSPPPPPHSEAGSRYVVFLHSQGRVHSNFKSLLP